MIRTLLYTLSAVVVLGVSGCNDTGTSGTASQSNVKKWYSGGTLHGAKMSTWSKAPYADRLATSADFVTKLMQIDGIEIPPVDQIKPIAVQLEIAISTVNKSGTADNQTVAGVAAACWLFMKLPD